MKPVISTNYHCYFMEMDEDIQAMRKHLQESPEKRTPEMVKWSIKFHRMVANTSHNPIFSLLVNILMDFTEDLVLTRMRVSLWDGFIHDDHSHPAILDKIAQKDAKGVKRLYYNHLLDSKPVFESWEKDSDVNFFSAEKKSS